MNEDELEFVYYRDKSGEIIAWCVLQYGKVSVSSITYTSLVNNSLYRDIDFPPPDKWKEVVLK